MSDSPATPIAATKSPPWAETRDRNQVSGRFVASASLAATHPDLAAEWHPTLNGDLTPNDVSAGMKQRAWWKCPNGPDHEWPAAIWTRTRSENPSGCPYCRGLLPSSTNSLATHHPDLAAEWDYERNRDPVHGRPLTPNDFLPGSSKKVHWICAKAPDHRWEAIIANRTKEGIRMWMSQLLGPQSLRHKHPGAVPRVGSAVASDAQ
jgi:hypothetical protein